MHRPAFDVYTYIWGIIFDYIESIKVNMIDVKSCIIALTLEKHFANEINQEGEKRNPTQSSANPVNSQKEKKKKKINFFVKQITGWDI